ncbi:MAG: hypothetical protein IKD89_08145 [Clostridia bacterium]|nr:hypothetical protein [Clostridia bacterium]
MRTVLTAVFSAAAFFLALVRLNTAMEPDGLFAKGHPLTYALSALLIVFFLLNLLLSRKKDGFAAFDTTKETPHKFAKIMAFCMLAAGVITAAGFIMEGMGQRFELRIAAMMLLSLITAFTFLPMAVFFGTGKYKSSLVPTALVPVFTTAVMLVVNYISVTQMATPAQYGYLIIAQLANVLCFYYLAKFLSGAPCAGGALVSSSFAAAANAAAYLAPFVYAIIGGTFGAGALQNVLGAVMCFYSIGVLTFITRESRK